MTKEQDLPTRAFTKPSVLPIVFLIIVILLWVPTALPFFINIADLQGWFFIGLAIYCVPLGFVCAYFSGLYIAKICYHKLKRNMGIAYLILFTLHVFCVVGCIIREMATHGYDNGLIKMCGDSCSTVNLSVAICPYVLMATLILLPAYYSVYRFYSWTKSYKIKA